MTEKTATPPGTPPEGRYEDGMFHKEAGATVTRAHAGSDDDDDEVPVSPDVQAGIQNMQAITATWTRTALIAAYIQIWIIYFIDSMQQVNQQIVPYKTQLYADTCKGYHWSSYALDHVRLHEPLVDSDRRHHELDYRRCFQAYAGENPRCLWSSSGILPLCLSTDYWLGHDGCVQ